MLYSVSRSHGANRRRQDADPGAHFARRKSASRLTPFLLPPSRQLEPKLKKLGMVGTGRSIIAECVSQCLPEDAGLGGPR